MNDEIETPIDVSVIITIFNGSKWIDGCFESIIKQSAFNHLSLEICVCNDASTDNTKELLLKWGEIFWAKNVNLKIWENLSENHVGPTGVGYGKNRAVSISKGMYLCFQDIDDVMLPNRIWSQYNAAISLPANTLIGSKFEREPKDSTKRYRKWANNLTLDQLNYQIYTSNGPTVIMPTWFCHKAVFDNVGGFSEKGKGTPEDLIFFYKHLDLKGKVFRVNEVLLIYNFHPEATTFSISEDVIWKIRLEHLENNVLRIPNWDHFTIWNAGKQGRKLYNSLQDSNKKKVLAFCDVDEKKINNYYTPYDPVKRKAGKRIPIHHFSNAKPPFLICVKMDMTEGVFEANLRSLNLTENEDYIVFS